MFRDKETYYSPLLFVLELSGNMCFVRRLSVHLSRSYLKDPSGIPGPAPVPTSVLLGQYAALTAPRRYSVHVLFPIPDECVSSQEGQHQGQRFPCDHSVPVCLYRLSVHHPPQAGIGRRHMVRCRLPGAALVPPSRRQGPYALAHKAFVEKESIL